MQYHRDLNEKDKEISLLKKEIYDKDHHKNKASELERDLDQARREREKFE